jgi:hypothetical protein
MDGQGNLDFRWSDEGDGTIARRSAAWLTGPQVKHFLVPVGHYPLSNITREHAALWLNPPVRDLLGALLVGQERPPYTYAAVDGEDADNLRPQVRVRLVAQDADGKPLSNAYALAFGLNPQNDAHFLLDDGRGVMPLSRQSIVQPFGGGLSFEVEFHWREGNVDRSSPRQRLMIPKL